MNESYETNIKHGYNLMVCEARGANFKSRGRIYATRGAILGPPGAGFFNYVSPGGWTCQVANAFWPKGGGAVFSFSIENEKEN